MAFLFVSWRDSLRSMECAQFKISEAAVSTFTIFLASPQRAPGALRSVLIWAAIRILPRHLRLKNVSQNTSPYSFNYINSAHSALWKLICFTNAQIHLIVSFEALHYCAVIS